MANIWDNDEKESEESEKSGWEKQLEKERSERELLEGSGTLSIYDIPDRLEPTEAIWYYNVLDDRRDEVYTLHFAKLKRMEDWLEIYVAAKDGTPAHELAYAKLTALELPISGWVELHEARFHDERIVGLCNRRIDTLAGNDFHLWLEAYDKAPFGSQIQHTAMRRMKNLAKELEEWQVIYDRSEIGSNNQIMALQNILLKTRFAAMRRKNKSDEEERFLKQAASRKPEEWRAEYEANDFYSNNSEQAVISLYLSADLRSGETEGVKKTGAGTTPAPKRD